MARCQGVIKGKQVQYFKALQSTLERSAVKERNNVGDDFAIIEVRAISRTESGLGIIRL